MRILSPHEIEWWDANVTSIQKGNGQLKRPWETGRGYICKSKDGHVRIPIGRSGKNLQLINQP